MSGIAPGEFPWITVLTFLPLAGAMAVFLLGPRLPGFARALAVGVATAALVITLVLWHRFDPNLPIFQFQECTRGLLRWE